MNYGYNMPQEEQENVLEKYGRDITALAKANKIDPVIGRDEEIRSITRILSRKTKNNPVLIGEPGVGKTAIVEGLALRIMNGDVPDSLKNKTLWELENAITVHKETGRPKILMYSVSQNITDNQKEQMSQFKSVLIRENNYWIDYDDVNTIRSTFREHLEWDLINLMKQELRRVG